MSDLVKRDTDGWTDVLPAVGDLAAKIAQTEFVPEPMRGKPAVVAAAILYGRELGLAPMTSLRSVSLIKGRPALSSEAMRAMVLVHGHDIVFEEMTAARCVIAGRRRGQEAWTKVTFTMDDAKRMGVGGGQQYAKMPRQMLAARATAELCRLIFADVIGGLVADVEVEDEPRDELASVAPITTARRKRQEGKEPRVPTDPPEPTPAEPEPEPEPVLDDDIVDAEVVEEVQPEPEPADNQPMTVAEVAEALDAEVIEERPTGIALARQALSDSKAAGPITRAQLTGLQAMFKAIGVTDRNERLELARKLANVPELKTANDLTAAQASAVIAGLNFVRESDNPLETLRGL